MGYTRRRILTRSGATIAGYTLLSGTATGRSGPSCSGSRDYDYATPVPPDETSHEAVVSEAYGKLALSQDRPFWVWPVCSNSEPVNIEYEARATDGDLPSILVVDEDGLRAYKTKIREHPVIEWPVFSSRTENLGRFGTWTVPMIEDWGDIHLTNIRKKGESHQSWKEDMPAVKMHSLQCLNWSGSGSVRKRHTIEPGSYYVVFDWTDGVLSAPDQRDGTAEVSLRALHSVEDEVAGVAPNAMQQLYTKIDRQSSPLVDTAVDLAEAICIRVPDGFQQVSISKLQNTAPRAVHLSSTVKILLSILEDRLGYETSVFHQISEKTGVWTQWGMSVLPVVSSIDQLVKDACAVVDAEPSAVTEQVENMLLSLGIVIADLIAAFFGVAGRAAAFVTRMAHRYLLGFVARTLGLRTYLVLLRELYTMTLGGIREALMKIKNLTRAIAEEYQFIDSDEADTVEQMDERGLQSLNIDIDLFSLNPECTV